MAKIGGKQTAGEPPVFQFKTVQSAQDVPSEIWEKVFPSLRKEFGTVQRPGDIPSHGGNVAVNNPPPVSGWHPRLIALLQAFDGEPLTRVTT